MSLLLDTHVILWWLTDDPTLNNELRERLDHDPDVYLSSVSVWEIAMKQASGKLVGPPDLPERVVGSGFLPLPVDARHAIEAARLPLIHRDPFDRMLIAQARCEDLVLVTRDPYCLQYEVPALPC
ncbi:type II toxin-antitoxin system VapC family toxin [Nocardia caishijiensis]|uniref:PIN domain nuclease of toxin-antitoxin system n=1 Tax=Nocardia caishijiensis TaxID=184756 RepID=A0ABQ6YFG3_9NOCA|nr:type II toxin-antitoxin system VapC family toxin [Nocardia caishijiensis]KAF0836731.1 PIN domain nuclease of toxin-antitoxin system [Nocardia caishijiensis]